MHEHERWLQRTAGPRPNLAAADVELSPAELDEIEAAAAKITVEGGRYNEAGERMTNL